MNSESTYYTALYRARQTTDDFGYLVRIRDLQYTDAVSFYRY